MADKTLTFGDFFDEVKNTDIIPGLVLLTEWIDLMSSGEWSAERAMPLTINPVRNFAGDMVAMFAEWMQNICTDALYNSTSRMGHAFLLELTDKAHAHGFDVSDITSQPVTPTEAIVAYGFARVKKS